MKCELYRISRRVLNTTAKQKILKDYSLNTDILLAHFSFKKIKIK